MKAAWRPAASSRRGVPPRRRARAAPEPAGRGPGLDCVTQPAASERLGLSSSDVVIAFVARVHRAGAATARCRALSPCGRAEGELSGPAARVDEEHGVERWEPPRAPANPTIAPHKRSWCSAGQLPGDGRPDGRGCDPDETLLTTSTYRGPACRRGDGAGRARSGRVLVVVPATATRPPSRSAAPSGPGCGARRQPSSDDGSGTGAASVRERAPPGAARRGWPRCA
jgi:hypothetical protein